MTNFSATKSIHLPTKKFLRFLVISTIYNIKCNNLKYNFSFSSPQQIAADHKKRKTLERKLDTNTKVTTVWDYSVKDQSLRNPDVM